MRRFDSWSAFLVMLFLIVGLCGLFASYATSLPLERGMARGVLLDQVLADSSKPDAAARLEALRPKLGGLAKTALDGTTPITSRVAAARDIVQDEQNRELSSIAYRTRLMLAIVTLLAAVLGCGILGLARRTRA